MMDFPAGVELMTDLAAAEWVEERLASWPEPFTFPVGCAIPGGFGSYARIFHPIGHEHGGLRVPQRWADFAAERGKIAHAGMQFESLIGTVDWQKEPWDSMAPEWGGLPEEECLGLAKILTTLTVTPGSCWFCLWDGYGHRYWLDDRVWTKLPTASDRSAVLSASSAALEDDRAQRLAEVPRVRTLWSGAGAEGSPAREYLLFRGPVDAVATFRFDAGSFRSPNLWWPEDRTWCVATEVDGFTSFVGGTEAVIDAVLRAPGLEALPIDPGDRFDMVSDALNGPPPDLPSA
jgi:hypothetical protein